MKKTKLSNFKLVEKVPSIQEYQLLRGSTSWRTLPDKMVEKGLKNSWYGICIYVKDKIIGTGRIIGDRAIYFYLQDIIVLPTYQDQGVGTLILKKMLTYLEEHAPSNAFISLMAAEGTIRFYAKNGFKIRDVESPGMFKYVL